MPVLIRGRRGRGEQLLLIVSKPLMLLAYFCNIPSTAMEFQLTKFHGTFAEALPARRTR